MNWEGTSHNSAGTLFHDTRPFIFHNRRVVVIFIVLTLPFSLPLRLRSEYSRFLILQVFRMSLTSHDDVMVPGPCLEGSEAALGNTEEVRV